MRAGLASLSFTAAIVLTVAACGSKDKAANNTATATANTSGNVASNDTEAAADRLAAKVKDFNDQNGGCPECQPTEARVVARMDVPPGLRTYTATPSCMNEARDTGQIREVADDAAALSDGQYAGAVDELLRSQAVKRLISKKVGGDVGRILNGGDDRTAYCQAVCAVLPSDSTVTGYKLEAANTADGQFQVCQAGSDCAIGKAKWTAEPIPTSGENSKTVCGVFANWSHKDHRLARLSVYFTPPDNWVPPHR
jgi:hypothetical protein